MKKLTVLLAVAAAFVLPVSLIARPAASNASAGAALPTAPGAQEARARAERIQQQLHPVTGDVPVPGANAILHLGRDYYFLPANEARLVMTEGWGNPAAQANNVLGLVFPAGRTFTDDTWGAVITYQASGYVSDTDAASTDYGDLLTQMRSTEAEENAERTRQGFPAVHLAGWAQTPVYDPRTHSVVWARNIHFDGIADNTLNYDIRMLGRRGVLSLNMVSVMSDLTGTRAAAQRFASAAEFTPGERYADYQSSTDPVAEYGIGGLIAAGVGATLVHKAGVLAVILGFGKKIIFFVVAGFALLWRRIRGLFGRRSEEDLASYVEGPTEADLPPEPPAESGPNDVPAGG